MGPNPCVCLPVVPCGCYVSPSPATVSSSHNEKGCSYLLREAKKAVSASVIRAISKSFSTAEPSESVPTGSAANPVVIDSVIRARQTQHQQKALVKASSDAVASAFSKILQKNIQSMSNKAQSPSGPSKESESFDNLKKRIEQGLERQEHQSTKAENAGQQLLLTDVELHH